MSKVRHVITYKLASELQKHENLKIFSYILIEIGEENFNTPKVVHMKLNSTQQSFIAENQNLGNSKDGYPVK